MKAKRWTEVVAILVPVALICIFFYIIFPGNLEVVKTETSPLGSTYRVTTVTLKWHGRNGTLLSFENFGRDYMEADWNRTVNDGDEVTVYIPVGWAWVKIRYGGEVMNIDCYGRVTSS